MRSKVDGFSTFAGSAEKRGGRSSLSSISLSSLSFAGCSGERGGRKDSGGEEEQKGETTSTATVY